MRKEANTKCQIEDCEDAPKARGYCNKHYLRLRRHGDPLAGEDYRRFDTPAEQLQLHVKRTRSCWLWQRYVNSKGYGVINYRGQIFLVHRLAYEVAKGHIPPGLFIDHMCSNPRCANPDHLRLATPSQNQENYSAEKASRREKLRGMPRNVWRDKRDGYYYVRVTSRGKSYSAGRYETPEEAGLVARDLRNRLFTHNIADRIEGAQA